MSESAPTTSSATPEAVVSSDLLAEARSLVGEAFSQAKRSRNPRWRVMTTAVLNNRLLQLTDRKFTLRRFGCANIREFAALLPDVLAIDDSNPGQATVTYIVSEAGGEDAAATIRVGASTQSPRTNVRIDLWRAALDWSGRSRYVVDPATGKARRELPSDPDTMPRVEPVAEDVYQLWRENFIVDALADPDLDAAEKTALEQWRDERGSSRVLPAAIRDQWMNRLRGHVADHLTQWFESTGSPIPSDLRSTARADDPEPIQAARYAEAVTASRLRDVILKCVREMTLEELRRIDIPAEVIARIGVR